jgi:hypothetical protein
MFENSRRGWRIDARWLSARSGVQAKGHPARVLNDRSRFRIMDAVTTANLRRMYLCGAYEPRGGGDTRMAVVKLKID